MDFPTDKQIVSVTVLQVSVKYFKPTNKHTSQYNLTEVNSLEIEHRMQGHFSNNKGGLKITYFFSGGT